MTFLGNNTAALFILLVPVFIAAYAYVLYPVLLKLLARKDAGSITEGEPPMVTVPVVASGGLAAAMRMILDNPDRAESYVDVASRRLETHFGRADWNRQLRTTLPLHTSSLLPCPC
jgi:hypothetical protein